MFCQKIIISFKIVFFPENRKLKKQMNWSILQKMIFVKIQVNIYVNDEKKVHYA